MSALADGMAPPNRGERAGLVPFWPRPSSRPLSHDPSKHAGYYGLGWATARQMLTRTRKAQPALRRKYGYKYMYSGGRAQDWNHRRSYGTTRPPEHMCGVGHRTRSAA